MGNCLVTKLKESVNNDNLVRLGYLRVSPKSAGSGALNFYFTPETVAQGTLLDVTVKGDAVVLDANTQLSHQNETFSFNPGTNPSYPNILTFTSGTVDGGYIEFNAATPNLNIKSANNLKFKKSLETIVSYNCRLAIGGFRAGSVLFEGSPKLSEFIEGVKDDKTNLVPLVEGINLYNGNVEPDDQSIESLGIFTSVTQMVLVRDGSDTWNCDVDALAAAQVGNGRVSGTLALDGRVGGAITIRFGSSMQNPTPEETAQGYQIV